VTEPTAAAPEPAGPRGPTISVSTLAWVVVAAVFVLMRLGPVWQAPVGGPELIHLSGAWQAREGVSDSRFVPTLFQAISTALLHWNNSEVPSRFVAFLATATTPVALYLLRPKLGNAGALLALVFVVFDGPQIALGTEASAMGLDLAVTAWFFVALSRPGIPGWLWAAVGFAVASAGPVSLPLVTALAVMAAAGRVRRHTNRRLAFAGAGVLVAVSSTTARFGLGMDGLRLAPIDLFALGFDEPWSSTTAFGAFELYSWPLVVGGVAAGAIAAFEAYRRRTFDPPALLLPVWAGAALLWSLASLRSANTVPLAALSLPLALMLGPAVARGTEAMARMPRTGWQLAGVLLAAAAFLALVGSFNVLTWADVGDVQDNREVALVTGFFLMAAAAVGYVALDRRSAPALLIAALAVGSMFMVAASLGVALSGIEEPIPSPRMTLQAPRLRALTLDSAASSGGKVGINPLLAADATWAFRDSGAIVTAQPDEAAVLVWPVDLPQPPGWAPLEGTWALTETVTPPTSGVLDYVAWLADRNRIAIHQAPVNVFVRATK